MQNQELVFASDYGFHPEGVVKLKEYLMEELQKNGIILNQSEISYNNEDSYFLLRCKVAEVPAVSQLFLTVLQSMITKEKRAGGLPVKPEDYYDVSDSSSCSEDDSDTDDDAENLRKNRCIYRLHGHGPRVGASMDDSSPQAPDASETLITADDSSEHSYQKIWAQTSWEMTLDELVTNNSLAEIEKLTGTTLKKDWNNQQIYIASKEEKSCLMAYNKLENIQKYNLAARPYVDHVFYSEGADNFKVAIFHILEVKKKRFETTLFSTYSSMVQKSRYKELRGGHVVTCCPFDHKSGTFLLDKASKLFPAVEDESKAEAWMGDFKFLGKARSQGEPGAKWENGFSMSNLGADIMKAPSGSMTLQTSIVEHDTPHRVKEWVKEQQLTLRSDDQVPAKDPHPNRPSSSSSAAVAHLNPRTANPKMKQGESRVAFTPQASTDSYSNAISGNELSKVEFPSLPGHFHPFSKSDSAGVESGSVPSKKTPMASSTSTKDLKPRTVLTLRILGDTKTTTQISSRKRLDALPNGRVLEDGQSGQGTDHRVLSQDLPRISMPLNELASLAFEQAAQSQTTLPVEDEDQLAAFFSPLRNDEPTVLSNDSVMELTQLSGQQPVITIDELESLQAESEADTRQFHRTMNKFKPKPSHPFTSTKNQKRGAPQLELPAAIPKRAHAVAAPLDPSPGFFRQINTSIYEMLNQLRGFRGEIIVKAELGRTILHKVHPRDITTDKDSLCTVSPMDLQDCLLQIKPDTKVGPYTSFTNVLTTLPADIKHLVKMQGPSNEALWDETPATWEALYELNCIAIENGVTSFFTVNIDAEKFTHTIVEKHNLGTVFTHCVKRNWDIRFTATGCETKLCHEKYVQPILDSLYVKEGTQPYLEFTSKFPQFCVNGIRVKNSCQHKANGESKARLNVTEVRALSLERNQGLENECDYRAFIPDAGHRNPPGTETVWFEVGVSSSALDEHLKENLSLELGEEATWDIQKLTADGVAASIIEPALLVVKGSDGIGFYNNNQQPKVSLRSRVAPPSSKAAESVELDTIFW